MLIWLVFQLSLVSSTWTLGIFIPLYVGPGSSSTCSGWSRVITSISANSQTPFYSIVNPNDGPGDHGSQPSEAFRRCIPLLRPRSDAVVLGHIDTGDKSMSNVQAEIDTYAGWDSSYRPTGIFFDGVASEASLFSQYRTHATYARGKGFNFIGLDPGEMPDSGYFGIADLVNVYESSYASFNVDENVDNSSSTPVSKQSVWLTEAPTEGSYSAVISQLAKKGVAAAYISNLREDESGIPSQWTSFAADVGRVNGDSGRSASPTTNLTVDPSQTSYSGTSNTGVHILCL
ncbi:Spherulation-specific family 4-domain-containing protein [Collybia nuda]|uniref:Spherulation-specific family 4-domain-containing protein n=1 Tax=Collybia nuda TaxID=64659 RepID=A0A9P5Y4E4_9AGAR|nr:Spherulation-specific family 4-domain-containing protein [Collybia nuda]